MNQGQEPEGDLMSLSEAAEALEIEPVTLEAWRRRGWILADKTASGNYGYSRSEVERLIRGRP